MTFPVSAYPLPDGRGFGERGALLSDGPVIHPAIYSISGIKPI